MNYQAAGGRRQAAGARALLMLVFALFASGLSAQERTPDQAELLYQQVGDQLFCICGCREPLLSCSHNVCSSKDEERKFLRELVGNPKLDAAAIKQQMVVRFGKGVQQVPEESNLYPILIGSGLLLLAAFGVAFRVLTRRGPAPEAAPQPSADAEFEDRIARELKELE
jgi:cytochrome c-type biogenesis protein CcmH/NrfF